MHILQIFLITLETSGQYPIVHLRWSLVQAVKFTTTIADSIEFYPPEWGTSDYKELYSIHYFHTKTPIDLTSVSSHCQGGQPSSDLRVESRRWSSVSSLYITWTNRHNIFASQFRMSDYGKVKKGPKIVKKYGGKCPKGKGQNFWVWVIIITILKSVDLIFFNINRTVV